VEKLKPKIVLIKQLLSIFTLSLLSFPTYAVQTVCNDNGGAGWPINDGSNTTIPIEYIFGDIGLLTDLDVDVDISHTWMGDLTASVTSPGGTNVVLFERPGTTAASTLNGGPFGCPGNNLDVLFNDESGNPPIENATCGNNPAYSGNAQPHNAAPNNLSAVDGEAPTGIWNFNFMDPVNQDTGTMNEACLVVSAAAVTFDQWVSTNATCSDAVDALSISTGTNLFVCYTLSNPADESFTLSAGDWNDSLGNNLVGLEGTYNAGASQTINFGPFAAGTAPYILGTTVGTANVTVRGNSVNFPSTQNLFTDETVSISVSNVAPGAANKPLYLYNNLNLSRISPTTAQAEVNINEGATATWTLTPALQSNLAINATGGSIPLSLYLRELGNGNNRTILFTLSGSSSGEIATSSQVIALTGTATLYNINVPITVATNLVNGETITLTMTNNTTGSSNRRVLVTPSDGASNHSLVSLPSNTIINVDSITVHSAAFPAVSAITSAQAGNSIFIRAVISDPFGSFDITSTNHTITDPTPTVQVNNVAMTQVADSGTNTKTYEASYTVPGFPVLGDWRIDVLGNEGNEGINHSNFIDFIILAPPSLSVLKSASNGSANPGSVITYTITVTNTGLGIANSVVLNDTPSLFTDIDTGSFICSIGCPSSGVTMGTPTFTLDGDGDVTVWDLIMSGSLNGSGSAPNNAFSIQYTATIE